MIECKLCGHKSKYRIIEHLVKIHKFNIDEYKTKYGPVVTNEYSKMVSKKSVNKWKESEYRNKTNKARNDSWTDDKKKLQSEILKNCYKNGLKSWMTGLTKETDDRVKKVGEHNRKCLTGRTKYTHDYLQKQSDLMKDRLSLYWGKDGIFRKYFADEENNKKWRDKISKTISEKCKSGEIKCLSGHFKTGYYKNVFYQSGLELKAMEFFDSNKYIKSWEKNFDVIEYMDINDRKRRYLPDFKLILNDGQEIIIETKGYKKENDNQKMIYAKKKYKHYFICFSIKEIEEKINEIISNKINK